MAHCAEARERQFLVFVDEPARCMERAKAVEQEFASSMQQRLEKGYVLPGQAEALTGWAETAAAVSRRRCILLSALEMRYEAFAPARSFYFQMKSVNSYHGSFELLVKDLKQYKKEKYSVILLCNSRTRGQTDGRGSAGGGAGSLLHGRYRPCGAGRGNHGAVRPAEKRLFLPGYQIRGADGDRYFRRGEKEEKNGKNSGTGSGSPILTN